MQIVSAGNWRFPCLSSPLVNEMELETGLELNFCNACIPQKMKTNQQMRLPMFLQHFKNLLTLVPSILPIDGQSIWLYASFNFGYILGSCQLQTCQWLKTGTSFYHTQCCKIDKKSRVKMSRKIRILISCQKIRQIEVRCACIA